MRVSAQAFYAPKAGNKDSEYEDAFCPQRPLISRKASSFSFAVADGATETSFSGMWAKQLVRAFCKGEFDVDEISRNVDTLREHWLRNVSRKPMPWYAQEKIRSGAFAALVGLGLIDSPESEEDGTWKAHAIGDSCVFQIRDSRLIAKFPIQSSNQFTNSPLLLSSIATEVSSPLQSLSTMCDSWKKGDTFYLMTDAIACWFLTETENGRVPARELQNLSSGKSGHFQPWLNGLRDSKVVRNDDVTILRVEIENSE